MMFEKYKTCDLVAVGEGLRVAAILDLIGNIHHKSDTESHHQKYIRNHPKPLFFEVAQKTYCDF